MRLERVIHCRHHHKIPRFKRGRFIRSCWEHPRITNSLRRHFQRHRRLGPRRVHLLRHCSPSDHGPLTRTRHLPADVLAVSSSSLIRWFQRPHEQTNRLLLLVLDRQCVQHCEQLFRGESLHRRPFVILSGGLAEVHLVVLPRGKRRAVRQAGQVARLLPHDVCHVRTELCARVRPCDQRLQSEDNWPHIQRRSGEV